MSDGPFDTTFRVGEITEAEPFPEAETDQLVKLWIDLGVRPSEARPGSGDERSESPGDEEVQSAAQLGYNYDLADLAGRQVFCATNLGTMPVADFTSEVLTVGVPDSDGNPILVAPDEPVPLGGELY